MRGDLRKVLLANGWKLGHTFFNKGHARLRLDDETVQLIDRFYLNGFRDGLERGAYEEMTQEDAEPVHNLDPNGPAIPDALPE